MLWFINGTDNSDLMIEPVDNVQPITDSKDEKVRKQNKRAAKKKARLNNICILMQALAGGSAVLLLSCPTPVFCSGSSAPLLPCFGSPICPSSLFSCLKTAIILSHCLVLAPVLRFLAGLLPLLVLGPAHLHLASTVLKTIK